MYLEKFNKAREAISLANSVDELALIADQAEALRYAALQAKQSINVVNEASEIKFRAERRAGELIKEGQERGDIRNHGQRGSSCTGVEQLGITRKQSSTFKKVASIPEVEFDKQIEKMKRDNVEITRQKLINVVNEAMKPEPTRLEPKPFKSLEIGFDDPVLNILRTVYRQSEGMNMKDFRIWLNDLINIKIKNYEYQKREGT
ncbi:MAG: hypothetical protein O2887_17970 [Bacteroidetes bacterium]|nr:hypothetical protein [Bacteroidota bacterium]MDA1122343.1 hypothetical protein [Bacteroidota bacterium]